VWLLDRLHRISSRSRKEQLIWVYISEVFPNRSEGERQSLASFSHWFMNALILEYFHDGGVLRCRILWCFFSLMMVNASSSCSFCLS